LGEIARFAVVVFGESLAGGGDANRGTETFAIGGRALEQDLEPVDFALLGEIADKDLRLGIKVVGNDVQIAVIIEIEDDRRAAGFGNGEDDLAGRVAADELLQLGL
jgi:hypothetical protein